MAAAKDLAVKIGVEGACATLAVPRASYYRHHDGAPAPPAPPRPTPPRALGATEREKVLEILNSARFVDRPPREIYATLLDENEYYCSVRTMYRILEDAGATQERRDQLHHPAYVKPHLLATGPNQVWSWDITKLLGPVKWKYYHLYVIIDIFSRYVVGWMVAEREDADLAARLIRETCLKQGITPDQLVIHADRGPSMKSDTVAQLLASLGVVKSHSRPHVSDDNAYSEAQFKTLKYRPGFPDSFGSIEDARAFLRDFFRWYNDQHHHDGIALLTPSIVHQGKAQSVLAARQATLDAAYHAHPERFVKRPPTPPKLPKEVWINPPRPAVARQATPDAEAAA